MNSDASQGAGQKPAKDFRQAKPLVLFPRGVMLVGLCLAIAAFLLWLYNARQPSASLPSSDQAEIGDQAAAAVEANRLQKKAETHIVQLATTIGERNLENYDQLCQAADYIEAEFNSYGYKPVRQTYQVKDLDCFNIDVEIKGSKVPNEVIIIGAHYDSFIGSPGANDNGSGIAAILLLAEHFAESMPERSLRFVAWTNQEPPHFQSTCSMGSCVYAKKCHKEKQNIQAVLSLESIGFFTDAKGSQEYASPLNLWFPKTGNFIGFVSNPKSKALQESVSKIFRENAKIPSGGASLPECYAGICWSDHWSFWQEGYAGLMVTDSGPFRYQHWHKATDTPDKINFPEMAKVVEGLKYVLEDLAKVTFPEDAEEPAKETTTKQKVPNKDKTKVSGK